MNLCVSILVHLLALSSKFFINARINTIEIVSSPLTPNRLWGSPSLPFNQYRQFFLGVKWPEPEANLPSQNNAKVKDDWICTSILPMVPQGMHRVISINSVPNGSFIP